jgi:putative ABC transport system permease protein
MTSTMIVAARTQSGRRIADALRSVVTTLNPSLPIVSSGTLEDSVALGLTPQKVAASVAGSLGLVGLLLAAIGIYGVTAFTVASRTRELGIRVALGAKRGDIMRMVLGHGLRLTVIGCAIGLALSALLASALEGFLFGVPPLDPKTFAEAAALFTVVGLAACYEPARRATRADPAMALRHE